MSNFQYPNVTGKTTEEKVKQIVSFLRQLVDQLNYEGADAAREQTADGSHRGENG